MSKTLGQWGMMACLLIVASGCGGVEPQDDITVGALIKKILPPGPQEKRHELITKLGSTDADLRREAVESLSQDESAEWEITPKILSVMAGGDPDEQVRAASVRALTLIENDIYLKEVLKSAIRDRSVMVRRAVLKVLANRDDQGSLNMLLEILDNEEKAVLRADAAQGLGNYRERPAIRGLLRGLTDEQFNVSYCARQSLRKLTGEDFGYDQQLWQEWLSKKNELTREN